MQTVKSAFFFAPAFGLAISLSALTLVKVVGHWPS